MTQLTENLIAIVVPSVHKDRYFKLWNDIDKEWIIECQIDNENNQYVRNIGNIDSYHIVDNINFHGNLLYNKYDMYVSKSESNMLYRDYESNIKEYCFLSAESSFYSLLRSKKIFLDDLKNEKILLLEKIL
jgi:hypothetical protein